MAKQAEIIADRKAGMSRLEIAEKHGITLATVDNHIYRAKKMAEVERMKGAPVDSPAPLIVPERVQPEADASSVAPSKSPKAAPAEVEPPCVQPRKSSLRPTAYTGDYAVYTVREGCVIMDDLPSTDLDMFTAENLRMFAAELIEVAQVLERAL